MDSLAASGGYYVSCGGRYLMANETTITGSIGVIIQTLNYEQLFNKIGLASVVFKSGKFKDMLNGARPITPEERDYVQSFIMKTYDKFLGIVAKERDVPADVLRNTVADGRILSGKSACVRWIQPRRSCATLTGPRRFSRPCSFFGFCAWLDCRPNTQREWERANLSPAASSQSASCSSSRSFFGCAESI